MEDNLRIIQLLESYYEDIVTFYTSAISLSRKIINLLQLKRVQKFSDNDNQFSVLPFIFMSIGVKLMGKKICHKLE